LVFRVYLLHGHIKKEGFATKIQLCHMNMMHYIMEIDIESPSEHRPEELS
jgi:hypothetical protein